MHTNEGVNALGTYSVKMKLSKEIPQLLPMYGKRVKIYYKGVSKLCFNCFGKHQRKHCDVAKMPWIDYVKAFMVKYSNFPPEAFGRWAVIIASEKIAETKPMDKNSTNKNKTKASCPEQQIETDPREGTPIQPIVHDKEAVRTITPEVNMNSQHQLDKFLSDIRQESPKEPWPRDFGVPEDEEETDRMIDNMAANGIKPGEANLIIKARKKEYETALKKFNTENKRRKTKNISSKARNHQ
jgi:hypothetical protein